jgi:predicted phosphoribosyltransferase
MGERPYRDLRAGGRRLAGELGAYGGRDDVLVLGLQRGGVPVAYEVALALGAELDAFAVRKLGVPGHKELAMGAIASGGVRVLNRDVIAAAGISPQELERVAGRELAELARAERAYRGDRPPAAIASRTAIIVDDGLATGATMRAAIEAVRNAGAASVISAVPVAAPQTAAAIAEMADEFVCPLLPADFGAVGMWYRDFTPPEDEEITRLLRDAAAPG